MTDLLKLTSLCQNLECEYILNALMKDYTTFQIGGPCDILVRPYDEGQVAALIQFCAVNGIRWQVIGNGSNPVSYTHLSCPVSQFPQDHKF